MSVNFTMVFSCPNESKCTLSHGMQLYKIHYLFMSVERINFDIQQYKQGGPNTESTKGWHLCTINQTGRRSCS